jgi:hypothetical protein
MDHGVRLPKTTRRRWESSSRRFCELVSGYGVPVTMIPLIFPDCFSILDPRAIIVHRQDACHSIELVATL